MMLESKQYDWTPEEVKEMGQIVREKSEYMSKLIEDLNLTYRLKVIAFRERVFRKIVRDVSDKRHDVDQPPFDREGRVFEAVC